MQERQQFEAVFLQNLSTVDRIASSLCRRHGVTGDEADEFASWMRLRLVEDEYSVFRKFRGEAALATYLTVVIATLFREYRVKHWGRWRPSAAARRLGEVAVRLELLVYRDGLTLDQAARVLRSTGVTTLGDRELAALLALLPIRPPLRPVQVGETPLDEIPGPNGADDLIVRSEAERGRRTAEEALVRLMGQLPSEDQVILRMKFWEGLGISEIARGLGLEQKPLYRRLARLLAMLGEELAAEGVSREDAMAIVDEDRS